MGTGPRSPRRIGVDETSFSPRRSYVKVVNHLDSGAMLHVALGRTKTVRDGFFRELVRRELIGMQGDCGLKLNPEADAGKWPIESGAPKTKTEEQ